MTTPRETPASPGPAARPEGGIGPSPDRRALLDLDLEGGLQGLHSVASGAAGGAGADAAADAAGAAAIADEIRELVTSRFGVGATSHFFPTRGSAVEALLEAIRGNGGGECIRMRGSRHGYLDPPEPVEPPAARGRARVFRIEPRAGDRQRFLRYGDAASLEALLSRSDAPIAALLVEPVALRMNLVVPPADAWARARAASQEKGVPLVFDEGLTGMRFGPRGAGARLGVEPDAWIFGEALAQGRPLGLLVVPRSSPLGDAVAILRDPGALPEAAVLAAALDCLRRGADSGLGARLDSLGARLARGVERATAALDAPPSVERFGSCVGIVFHGVSPSDPAEPLRYDWQRYAAFARACGAGGVRVPSHPMIPMFVSAEHSNPQIDRAIDVLADALESASVDARDGSQPDPAPPKSTRS